MPARAGTPTCDYCQRLMEPTEAVAVLYRLLGRTDGPKVNPDYFPWCCTQCGTAQTDSTV